jgi:hypothetical protein
MKSIFARFQVCLMAFFGAIAAMLMAPLMAHADASSVLSSIHAATSNPPGWLSMVLQYLVIDAPMRLWKTSKPQSILQAVSRIGHQFCDLGHQVFDIVADLDKIIDSLIPQRLADPAAPAPAQPAAPAAQ